MKSNIIVFEEEVYKQMIEEIKKTVVETLSQSKREEEWINAEEAKKILNIKSKSKLQQLRDDNEIKFSQHGRSILYSRTSVISFIEKNVIG